VDLRDRIEKEIRSSSTLPASAEDSEQSETEPALE
jgi:hypothetical protein